MPQFTLVPVDLESFSSWRDRWQDLERRAKTVSVYTTFDWLFAWASVYQPRKLVLAHMVRPADGSTLALGLIEVDRLRGWRFAGGAPTLCRAPLCADGYEQDAWTALGAWLRSRPRAWSTLEASGVDQGAVGLPGASLSLSEHPTPCLSVPESFEAYLASLSGKRRHEIRRRLRRTQEAGVEVGAVTQSAAQGAFSDFLRMSKSGANASSKDERLVGLLECVHKCRSVELNLFEVRSEDVRIGVSIDLVHGDVSYPYNLAWEPDTSHLAPGILLTLNTVSYAIERKLRLIDLGPGEQTYKLALGFTPQTRFALHAVNRSTWGLLPTAAGNAYRRLRG